MLRSILTLLPVRVFLLAGLTAVPAASAQTQTPPATNQTIAFNIGLAYGMLQAGDGNFYSPSAPFYASCPNNSNQLCAFIYQITPAGSNPAKMPAVKTPFYSFQAIPNSSTNNADGLWPTALIVGTDGNLYGACRYGGTSGLGTIFRITLSGNFTLLKTFVSNGTTLDPGNQPVALIQGNDGNLYFTNGVGVYQLTPAGVVNTVYTYPYGTSDQPFPQGSGANSLVQGSDGNLYVTQTGAPGSASGGLNTGAIGQLTLGGGFSIVHTFASDGSEGNIPQGPLVEGSDGEFYGVTKYSNNKSANSGVAFKVSSGGDLTVLHTFAGGADGALVNSPFFLGSDGNFYGTTRLGGDMTSENCKNQGTAYGCGMVFQLTPSGTKTTIHNFEGGTPTSTVVIDNPQVDGAIPEAPLVQAAGGFFYGTSIGASPNVGTIFEISLASSIPAPMQLTAKPNKVAPGQPVTLTWQVLNAFSNTAQLCGAYVQPNPGGAGKWSGVQAGTLANGIYSGSVTITPTQSGVYNYGLTCGGNESAFATVTVTGDFTITTAGLAPATVGQPYSAPVAADGGTLPYSWTAAGLPDGITLTNASTATISGTPKQFGDVSVQFTVNDSSKPSQQAIVALPLKVISSLKLIPSSIDKAPVDNEFSAQLAATGGIPSPGGDYKWSITGGKLPPGLALNPATGAISGTPTKIGKFPVTFQVADYETTPATDSATIAINIVPSIQIAAVEFTQAIQVYQTLSDLKASLAANGGPPIPIVSLKPAVMRIYLTSVKNAATVELSADGAAPGDLTFDVQPNCAPADQRSHAAPKGCPSVDFYFTPPSGAWATTLRLTDENGNELEKETLNLTSQDTLGIKLKGVLYCATVNGGQLDCGTLTRLMQITGLASQIWPTASVTTEIDGQKINQTLPSQLASGKPILDYLDGIAKYQLSGLYGAADQTLDSQNSTRTDYVAIYPVSIAKTPDGTAMSVIGGHGLIISDPVPKEIGPEQALAHELGHTLGLHHTNNGGPQSAPPFTDPGCWATAKAEYPTSFDWPFSDNDLWNGPPDTKEYGFNVAAQAVLDPTQNFEIMAYCAPPWISPYNYLRALDTLKTLSGSPGGTNETDRAPLAEREVQAAAAAVAQWQVSGTIPGSTAALNPIFTQKIGPDTGAGSGTYSIVASGSGGKALYTRNFTPDEVQGDSFYSSTEQESSPIFSEWIPVTAGAESIAVLDPQGNSLASVNLTGAPPKVTVTSPAKGFIGSGSQTISWTAKSATATSFTSRIFYSIDGGKTWQQITQVTQTSDMIDFSTLPGANAALIRVDVSDGVNTGSAISVPFTVSKKPLSTITINMPLAGSIQPALNPVYLSGAGYGADDGVLTGKQLKWSDNLAGELGTGSPLSMKLEPGAHTITLTATGADGKSLETTTKVTLAGAPPALTLSTTESASCFNAAIGAVPGKQGANISIVNYSLNGGSTYTSIPLAELPFNLPVSGKGNINLVATAVDASGQKAAKSTELTIPSGCISKKLKVAAGTGQSAATGADFATPLSVLVTDAKGNPQAGVIVTFTVPIAGAGATLSSATATTSSSGIAKVTAKANNAKGSYQVTARAANATAAVSFALSNN